MQRNIMLVGDQDDRVALAMQTPEQRHNFVAGGSVQITGRLIRRMMEGLFTSARATATR